MIKTRSEEALGELFCFFIIETILIAKALNMNPFNQPAVELIKKETKNNNFFKIFHSHIFARYFLTSGCKDSSVTSLTLQCTSMSYI